MNRFRTLTAADVEIRVGQCSEKGVSLLLYKDARVDMRLLDETVGPENWQCRYDTIDGKLFCSVGVKCGDEWVWKQDVGSPSNMEADKGEASDAFKRACFRWGIGRELYTAPFIWVPSDKCTIKPGKNGKPACYDKFAVATMDVDDGRITALAIRNAKSGAIVYRMNVDTPKENIPSQNAPQSPGKAKADDPWATVKKLKAEAVAMGLNETAVNAGCDACLHGKRDGLTADDIATVETYLSNLIATH